MKYCPACKASYTDDSLNFCLKDGTSLTFFDDQSYEVPTVVLDEPETVVRSGDKPVVPYSPKVPEGERSKRPNTFLAVLLTVFIMLFISAVAVALWLYFENKKYETVQNTNATLTPSPKASVKTSPTASNTNSTPAAAADPEQVKSEVQKKIFLWKSLSEARDLESNLQNYAEHVDYYLKKNASRDFIRDDKRKASSLYDSIRIDLTNLRIIPDPTGEKATAVFDKEWELSGPGKFSAGKVQQQLQLEKIDGQWLITAEKDLKLYYKNN